MARALRVCPVPGCPELTTSGRCTNCQRQFDKDRGSRQQRGYGRDHERERERWEQRILNGVVSCARCDTPIRPGDRWDLDHTEDRTGYLGASCMTCNRAAGGRQAHQ